MPCPNPVACPGAETPTLNLTSEEPDSLKYFGYSFFGASWGLCIASTPELAALCSLPFPSNPPAPVMRLSDERTCTVPCFPTPVTYTVEAGSFADFTADAANERAYAFACELAQLICDGQPPTFFVNLPQSCSVTCVNNTVSTITVPAGVALGLTQEDANAQANALACALADILCNQTPDPGGIPPFGGAGSPPGPTVWYTNATQSCSVPCPDGQSTFHHRISGGLFYATSPSIANAIAVSYACNQNTFTPACLTGIQTDLCLNEPYADQITVSVFDSSIWEIVAGELPLGLAFDNGMIAGTPQETGTHTFTVRCSHGSDYVERTYTLTIRAITTPSTLPDATANTAYAAALSEEGFTSPEWTLIAGALPAGLSLNPNTGVISGTPTVDGDFTFTVAISEGPAQCSKEFGLTVESGQISAQAWWTLDQAFPAFVDSASGQALNLLDGDGNVAGKLGATVDSSFSFTPDIEQTAPSLAYQGTGWSVAIWFRRADFGTTIFIAQIDYRAEEPGGDDIFAELSYRSTGAAPHRVDMSGSSGSDTVQITGEVVSPDWNLWVITFDPADGKMRNSINNGAFHESAGFAFATAAPASSGTLRVFGNPAYFDEVAFYQLPLTAAQVSAIWNAGAGITWPTTIPA